MMSHLENTAGSVWLCECKHTMTAHVHPAVGVYRILLHGEPHTGICNGQWGI